MFVLTSFRERALSSASQAGLVNNLNDGLAWGLFPLYFAASGLSVRSIGVLTAFYPAVWGLGQLVTGPLSDRVGRVAHRRGNAGPGRRRRPLAGVVADAFSVEAAIWAVAALTAGSGAVVAVRMYETHPPSAREE